MIHIDYLKEPTTNLVFTAYKMEQPLTYTVSFDTQGGMPLEALKEMEEGTFISPPAEPQKSGGIFAGWYREAECINAWEFSADWVLGDMTLYAKWTSPKEQVISETNSYHKTYGNSAFIVDAKASGEGKMTYHSANPAVATISPTGLVQIIGAGKTTVTVKTEASTAYQAAEKKFIIEVAPISLSKCTISSIAAQSYTGKEIMPPVTVSDGVRILKAGEQYQAAYTNHILPGKATITITGKGGNYSGTQVITFSIMQGQTPKGVKTNSCILY